MTRQDIEADTRSDATLSIDEVSGETEYSIVCVSFQIEATLWDTIKSGDHTAAAALVEWIENSKQ
jgi:hypothetical protein